MRNTFAHARYTFVVAGEHARFGSLTIVQSCSAFVNMVVELPGNLPPRKPHGCAGGHSGR